MILATQFHALSHPTRADIVELLKERELCVHEISDAMKMGQSAASFHLKALAEAGIIRSRKERQFTYYSLNPAALVLMAERLMVLAGEVEVAE